MPTDSQSFAGIAALLFVIGWLLGVVTWYYGVRMFLGRQKGLLPYVHSLWFLLDKYLDAEGIMYRAKFARYLLASATCFASAFLVRAITQVHS